MENVKQLLEKRNDGVLLHRESQTLEFKESFNFSGLAEYFRDFAAFANNKGGFLIFGIKDRPKRTLVGLTQKSYEQFDKLDPEKISGYLLENFSGNITWEHNIIEIGDMKFGYFYVHEANIKPIICKKDEKDELKNGEIYFRYGGRTQKIQHAELEAIINHRIEKHNSHWIDLITKIGKTGPQNAAILDIDKGKITKNAQVLLVDDKVIEKVKWIKEGSFEEKQGAPTLKLIGDVQPLDKYEVIQVERRNKLKDYPLSAKELAQKIKEKSGISQNDVWRIINENDIKKNIDYSDYNFRNNSQQENYDKNGIIPQGTPSIYKECAIDFIINIYKNEHN